PPPSVASTRERVRAFMEEHVYPNEPAISLEDDDAMELLEELRVRAREAGLWAPHLPPEAGGTGEGFLAYAYLNEEIGRSTWAQYIFNCQAPDAGNGEILHMFGTPEQKEQFLRPLVEGTTRSFFSMTEPEVSGADPTSLRTRAELVDGEWVINGAKAFITNSGTPITSLITVTALTGPGEISTIIVPSGTPGLIVEPPYDKLGWRSSDTHGLTFDNCRVPEANLLGERGAGFRQFLDTLDGGRIAISALAVGLAQACLDESVRYANERQTFGEPIGSRQAVAFAISDVAVAVEAARLLTYKAAWLRDAGRPSAEVKQAAARAKLYSSEAAVAATRTATQVFGGNGFMEAFPVARFYRDAKVLEIGEGTSEVQRMVIARGLGLPVS
ncbi:MAG TPA: acyl-CoA dehydrogenase family protein, partial [Jatrophihabitantaceae bacterium]